MNYLASLIKSGPYLGVRIIAKNRLPLALLTVSKMRTTITIHRKLT